MDSKDQLIRREKRNLSFAGCGFLGIYHVGVAAAFREYAPDLAFNRISGASAGAMAAVCLVSGTPLKDMANDILALCTSCRSYFGGAFNPKFNVSQVIEQCLQKILPDNVHELVNGKLHISVTRVYDGENVIINNFVSKKEVVDAVVASTFIPLFSGFIPYRYRGVRVIDGGFSDNSPKLDDSTISVSPFAGDSSICPRDTQRNKILHRLYFAEMGANISLENISRLRNVLFPPPTAVLAELCSEGFRDAVEYLQKNDLISCTRCLCTISSIYTKNNSDYMAKKDEDPDKSSDSSLLEHTHEAGTDEKDCIFCQNKIERAKKQGLPDQVMSVFNEVLTRADNLKQRSYTYRYLWPIISYTPPVIVTRWFFNLSFKMGEKVITALQSRIPMLQEDEKLFQLLENGIVFLLKKFSQIHEVRPEDEENKWYFACDVDLTQIGGSEEQQLQPKQPPPTDSPDNLSLDDRMDKLLSVEIMSIIKNGDGLTAENPDAVRFQADNLWNAVYSDESKTRISSRRGSLAVNELLSAFSSRRNSRQASRQISRRNSICSEPTESINNDPLDQIIDISENEKTVFDLHYQNHTGELVTVAMYDVSEQTDKNLDPTLIQDRLLKEQRLRETEVLVESDENRPSLVINAGMSESGEFLTGSSSPSSPIALSSPLVFSPSSPSTSSPPSPLSAPSTSSPSSPSSLDDTP